MRYDGRFGSVTVSDDAVTIAADGADTYEWAHRIGAIWPCSVLSSRTVAVGFDRGGLFEMDTEGDDYLGNDELSAWAYDAVADAVPADIAAPWLRVISPDMFR